MNTAAGRVIGAENTMQNISVLMCRFFFDKYNVVHTTYSIIPITIIARLSLSSGLLQVALENFFTLVYRIYTLLNTYLPIILLLLCMRSEQ